MSFVVFIVCGQRWKTQQWVRLPVTIAVWLILTIRLFYQVMVLDLYVMFSPPLIAFKIFPLTMFSGIYHPTPKMNLWLVLFHSFWKIVSHHLFKCSPTLLLFFFWDSNYTYVSLLLLHNCFSFFLIFSFFFFFLLCISLYDFYWLIFKSTDVIFLL